MIEMAVRMHDEQRDLCIILVGQQLQYLFSEWHLCEIRDRAGIDQKRFIRPDEQVEEISFETRAQTLAQDKRLRLVYELEEARAKLRHNLRHLRPNVPPTTLAQAVTKRGQLG